MEGEVFGTKPAPESGNDEGRMPPASAPRDVQRRMNDAVPDDGMPPIETLR